MPSGSVLKNPSANAGDVGLTSRLARSPEEEMATHSSILAWKIPWTEDPGGIQSTGSQGDMNEGTEHTHTHTHEEGDRTSFAFDLMKADRHP